MTEVVRLIRFVGPGVLPPGVVAEFDKEKNLLRIDQQFYAAAPDKIQRQLWRAQKTLEIQPKE